MDQHTWPNAFLQEALHQVGNSEVEIYNTQSKDWIYNQFSQTSFYGFLEGR